MGKMIVRYLHRLGSAQHLWRTLAVTPILCPVTLNTDLVRGGHFIILSHYSVDLISLHSINFEPLIYLIIISWRVVTTWI